MEDVDQSIASQNAIVAAIGGKLKTLRTGIAASKKTGDDTLLTIPPIVQGINDKLDIIKKMLAEAKRIKVEWTETNNQLATLGKQKAATSEALVKKDKQIAEMTARLRDNEATAVANHERLTQQRNALDEANKASIIAKEKAEASLAALQQQSAAATQQQQAALQAALQGKTAAEELQRRAEQELAQTKASLGTSQQHANAMQAHMNKLGDLKKHQADLTAALNALNAEIEAANDDMRSLDAAHVQHLGAIKNQLQSLDEELRKIIAADPGAAGSGGPGMGPGSGAAGSGGPGPGPSVYATRVHEPGTGDSQRRHLSRSGRGINPSDLDDSDTDTDDGPAMMLPRSRGAAGGEPNVVAAEVDRINRNLPPRPQHATSSEEDELLNAGLSGSRSGPSPFARSVPRSNRRGGRRTRRRQRGGYIAVRKTRSKSSSSSGRRGTRRSSSSRSKSTRRRRHRSSSSSSRR
jgi:chemotaxis protein histidine kinase CheA